MTEPNPTRWRRRAEARPDEILDAALDEFIARGFDAARMEDIARRAGLSKAGVYLYFDTKQDLLAALILRAVKPVASQLIALAAAPPADPAAALRLIVTMALTRLADGRLFAVPRLVLSIAGQFPEIAAFYRAEIVDPARTALAGLIRAGIAAGQFRAVDADAVARMIAGPVILEALLNHAMGIAPEGSAQDRASAMIDVLLQGIAA